MEAQYPNEVLIAIDFAPKDLRNPTKYPSRKCFDFLYFTTYKMNIQDINVESKLIRKLKGGGLNLYKNVAGAIFNAYVMSIFA